MINARFVFLLALAAAAAPARAQSIMAGEWQITLSQSAMPGAPPAAATQCVSGFQAADPGVIARRAPGRMMRVPPAGVSINNRAGVKITVEHPTGASPTPIANAAAQ